VRIALFSALWVRADDGDVVASNDNPAAIDDLEWLGLETDQMVDVVHAERSLALAESLVEQGLAYPCFCSTAELREMSPAPPGHPDPVIYDGRCRRLSANDRKVLRKAGRKPAIRLINLEETPAVLDARGRSVPVAHYTDFRLFESEDEPTPITRSLIALHDAEVDRAIVASDEHHKLGMWSAAARALGWALPRLAIIPPLQIAPAESLVGDLRAAGFHPHAVFRAALSAGWDPGDAHSLDALVGRFEITAIREDAVSLGIEQLRALNRQVLADLGEDERVEAVVDHLERRGFPIRERDRVWQERFVAAVSGDMVTLADAEPMAVLLLTQTVDYDRDTARVLRAPETHTLISQFERTFQGIDTNDEGAWRTVLSDFRQKADAPGRALVTLRLVLTGQRQGPNLAAVLALLGNEGCRSRLDKARRYTA
jgi:glutamyl/glutaminyl-tRNA synthetase